MDVGLVVLNVQATHTSGSEDSPALVAAQNILESRGTAPRLYRNALIFLAADGARQQDLDQAARILLGLALHRRGQRRARPAPTPGAPGATTDRIGRRHRQRPHRRGLPLAAGPQPEDPPGVRWNGRKSACADQAPWHHRPAAACSTTKCSLPPWPGPGCAWSWTACPSGAAITFRAPARRRLRPLRLSPAPATTIRPSRCHSGRTLALDLGARLVRLR